MKPQAAYNTDSWPRYDGVLPCRVVDINDPEKLGRIRCRIHQSHGTAGDISDENLPWIFPIHALAGLKHGVFALPEAGTDGWVAFFLGNYRFPVFIGEHYGSPNGVSDVPDEFFTDYPNVRGYVDPAGFKVLFNAVQKTLTVEDAHGNLIRLDSTGTVGNGGFNVLAEDPFEIHAVDICSIISDEDMTVTAKKDLSITVKQDAIVTLEGKSLVTAKDDIDVDAYKDVKISSRNGDITIDARVRDIKLKARSIKFESAGDVSFHAGGKVILDG